MIITLKTETYDYSDLDAVTGATASVGFGYTRNDDTLRAYTPNYTTGEIFEITHDSAFVKNTIYDNEISICESIDTTLTTTFADNAVSFQWQKFDGENYLNISDDVNYSGTTTYKLFLTSLDSEFNGNMYKCLITYPTISESSNVATLNIIDSIGFINQPVEVNIIEDEQAVFSVTAAGDVISYQWKKDGIAISDDSNISGSQTETLTILNASGYNLGVYTCEIIGECNLVESESAFLSFPTSISDLSKNGFFIYPNPSNGILNISIDNSQFNNSNIICKITDIHGKIIFESLTIENKQIIDLSEKPKGIYLVQFKTDSKSYFSKIVIM